MFFDLIKYFSNTITRTLFTDNNSILSFFELDVALHKSAVQSSTDHNGFASRAVDGNYKFSWKDGSCTHTKNERNPWWRVDLGREYIVTGIPLFTVLLLLALWSFFKIKFTKIEAMK